MINQVKLKQGYYQYKEIKILCSGTRFKAKFLKYDYYFNGDKEKRDIYNIILTRDSRHYSFTFGQSINNSGYKVVLKSNNHLQGVIDTEIGKRAELYANKHKCSLKSALNRIPAFRYRLCSPDAIIYPKKPSPYDVLACLCKHDVGSFEDFCNDFGYDTDSRNAEKTYHAVVKEYNNVKMLYNDKELELMAEIA